MEPDVKRAYVVGLMGVVVYGAAVYSHVNDYLEHKRVALARAHAVPPTPVRATATPWYLDTTDLGDTSLLPHEDAYPIAVPDNDWLNPFLIGYVANQVMVPTAAYRPGVSGAPGYRGSVPPGSTTGAAFEQGTQGAAGAARLPPMPPQGTQPPTSMAGMVFTPVPAGARAPGWGVRTGGSGSGYSPGGSTSRSGSSYRSGGTGYSGGRGRGR